MKKVLFLIVFALIFSSCSNNIPKTSENNDVQNPTNQDVSQKPDDNSMDDDKFENLVQNIDFSEDSLIEDYKNYLKLIGTKEDKFAWNMINSIMQNGYCIDETLNLYHENKDKISDYGKIILARVLKLYTYNHYSTENEGDKILEDIDGKMLLDSSRKIYDNETLELLYNTMRDLSRSVDMLLNVLDKDNPISVSYELLKDRQIISRIYNGKFKEDNKEYTIAYLLDKNDSNSSTFILIDPTNKEILDEINIAKQGFSILKGSFLENGKEQILLCNTNDNNFDITILYVENNKLKTNQLTYNDDEKINISLDNNYKLKLSLLDQRDEFKFGDEAKRYKHLYFRDDKSPRNIATYFENRFNNFLNSDLNNYIHISEKVSIVLDGEDASEFSNEIFGPDLMLVINKLYKIEDNKIKLLDFNINSNYMSMDLNQ